MTQTLNVLVTRPDPAGSELCQRIHAAGDQALHLPTIAIATPSNNALFQAAMASLGQQDYVIFISPQAVFASLSALKKQWPILPASVQFLAIGESTAKALQAAGYAVFAYPQTEWNSEALLDLPFLKALTAKKIAVVRGEGGREHLEKILLERGAIVLSVLAYQRVIPNVNIEPYVELLNRHQLDVIICTSFIGVQHLKEMLPETTWPILKNIPLIVVSERIKRLAHDLGFQTIWVAANASHPAILTILAQRRTEIWQIKQMKA